MKISKDKVKKEVISKLTTFFAGAPTLIPKGRHDEEEKGGCSLDGKMR